MRKINKYIIFLILGCNSNSEKSEIISPPVSQLPLDSTYIAIKKDSVNKQFKFKFSNLNFDSSKRSILRINHLNNDSFADNIRLFINDVIIRSNVSENKFYTYFGPVSEVEYIMKTSYKSGFLDPYKFDTVKNYSVSLSYFRERFMNTCIRNNFTVKKITFLKNYMDGRVFKVAFSCSEIFYFVYSLDYDSKNIIYDIFDKNKISLIRETEDGKVAGW
ncbi:MAG: hypothetical protein H7321_01985 [Bacteroidia bacterium]|nr:hypothetical protein [Bacteroidia bacterium]